MLLPYPATRISLSYHQDRSLADPISKIKKILFFLFLQPTRLFIPCHCYAVLSYATPRRQARSNLARTSESPTSARNEALLDKRMSGQEPVQELRFPEGCDSLLARCVHIMHTIDPIEKADLTLLLGQQWNQTIQARNSKECTQAHEKNEVELLPLGRATPPEKPSRPDTLEFVRPGFGVKVGRAGSLCKEVLCFRCSRCFGCFCSMSSSTRRIFCEDYLELTKRTKGGY